MSIVHTGLTVDQLIEKLLTLQVSGYGSVHATVTDANEKEWQVEGIEFDSNEYGDAVWVVIEDPKPPEPPKIKFGKKFQIGSSESHDIMGSRAAQATNLRDAKNEARELSKASHVRESWLREVIDGELGDVITVFRNGKEEHRQAVCLTPSNCVLGTGMLRANCAKCQAHRAQHARKGV